MWCVLVPIVGLGRLLLVLLRLFLSLRPKVLLTLLVLAFALALPNPITAQLRTVWLTPTEQMSLAAGTAGVVVLSGLVLGFQSRALRRLRRRLERSS